MTNIYSPYINHFIQPDTIIPNPSDPQSWNRYSYVNNRPISFIDPTGNFDVCLIQCKPKNRLSWGKLTENGKELYRTYTKMWDTANEWWWDEYGDDGEFTLDEFMAINWHYEQANWGASNPYNEAVRNASSSWSAWACNNKSFSCDLSSFEGSLNFLGYYSQVAKSRAKACGFNKTCDLGKTFNPTAWNKVMAGRLVSAIHNATPTTEFNANDWFAVGNVSMNDAVYRKMIWKGWTGPVVDGENPMIILSYCQATFAWWAIAEGEKNNKSPRTYLSSKNYNTFCP